MAQYEGSALQKDIEDGSYARRVGKHDKTVEQDLEEIIALNLVPHEYATDAERESVVELFSGALKSVRGNS